MIFFIEWVMVQGCRRQLLGWGVKDLRSGGSDSGNTWENYSFFAPSPQKKLKKVKINVFTQYWILRVRRIPWKTKTFGKYFSAWRKKSSTISKMIGSPPPFGALNPSLTGTTNFQISLEKFKLEFFLFNTNHVKAQNLSLFIFHYASRIFSH